MIITYSYGKNAARDTLRRLLGDMNVHKMAFPDQVLDDIIGRAPQQKEQLAQAFEWLATDNTALRSFYDVSDSTGSSEIASLADRALKLAENYRAQLTVEGEVYEDDFTTASHLTEMRTRRDI